MIDVFTPCVVVVMNVVSWVMGVVVDEMCCVCGFVCIDWLCVWLVYVHVSVFVNMCLGTCFLFDGLYCFVCL